MPEQTTIIECKPRSFKLAFKPDLLIDIEAINSEILEGVKAGESRATLAYTRDGRAVTFAELAASGFGADIPDDGSELLKVLTFDLKEDHLFVKAGSEKYPLSRLKLTIAYKKTPADDDAGQASEAQGDGKPAAEYIADVFVVTKSENGTAETRG